MRFQTGVEWSNPLTQRVMRHYNISALYRPASLTTSWIAAAEPSASPASTPDDGPIVPAHLVAPDTGTPLEAPLVIQPVPSAPREAMMPTPSRVSPQAPARRETVGPLSSVAPKAQTVTPPRAQPEPELTTIEEQPATAESQTETTLTDDVWRRLQTIFRRHQEKAAASDTEIHQAAPEVPARDDTATAQGSAARGIEPVPGERQPFPKQEESKASVTSSRQTVKPAKSAVPGERDTRSEQPTALSSRRGAIDRNTDEPDRDVTKAMEDAALAPSGEAEPPRQATPTADREAIVKGTEMPPLHPAAVMTDAAPSVPAGESASSRQPSPPPPSADVQSSPTAVDGLSQPEGAQPKTTPTPEALPPTHPQTIRHSPETPHLEPQPAPLHEVWHVERILPEAPAATPPMRSSVSTQEIRQESQPAVEEILSNIAAAGFTRSSVEILPPRHPRPRQMSPKVSRPPVQSMEPTTVAVEPSSVEGAPEVYRPATTTRANAQPSPASRQLIETEIGPLPSDLWHLIGESPPVLHASQPTGTPTPLPSPPVSQAEHAGPPPASSPDIQTQLASPGPAPSEKAGVGTPGMANVIRRMPDETAQTETTMPPDQATLTTQAPRAQPQGAQQQEETSLEETVDIEALARRVYSEIRRRIHTELERVRRR